MAESNLQKALKTGASFLWFLLSAASAVLVFTNFRPCPAQGDVVGITQFVAASYALLVAGVMLIWNPGSPDRNDKTFDLDAFVRDRLKATIAILTMVTLLGVATLITYAVVTPKRDTDPPKVDKKDPSEATCRQSITVSPCPMWPADKSQGRTNRRE